MTATIVAEPGSPEAIAERVKAARLRAGLRQNHVAEALGWATSETVSAVERGERQIKAHELVRLAEVLRVPVAALLGVEDLPAEPFVLWRTASNEPHANADIRRTREATLVDRAHRYAHLVEWTNEPATQQLPMFEIDPTTMTTGQARILANQCRDMMRLGAVPARGLVRSLEEQYGVKLFYQDLSGDGDGSAACTLDDRFGAAILVNSAEVPWRQMFSIAHELFHLVTWESTRRAWDRARPGDEPDWYRSLEQRAQTFAGTLLLPDGELQMDYEARTRGGPLTAQDAAQMAMRFEVSLHALAIRLNDLRLVSDEIKAEITTKGGSYDRALRTLTSQRDRRMPSAFTRRYQDLVFTAFRRGEIGRSKAAAMLEVRVPELRQFGFDEPDGEAETTAS